MQKKSIKEIQEPPKAKTDHTSPVSKDFFQNKLQQANSLDLSPPISPYVQPKEIAILTLSSFDKKLKEEDLSESHNEKGSDNTTKLKQKSVGSNITNKRAEFRDARMDEPNLITLISTISAYKSNILLNNNTKEEKKQIEEVKQKYILEPDKKSFEFFYLKFRENVKSANLPKNYATVNNPYYANADNAASENVIYVLLEQVVFKELKNEHYLLGTDGVSTCLALLFFGASESKKFGATAHLTYLQIEQIPFVIESIKNGFISHGAELTHAAMLGGDIEDKEDEMEYEKGKKLFLDNLQNLESVNIFYKKPNKNLEIDRENEIDILSSNNSFGEEPTSDAWVTLNGFKYKDYNITYS